MTTALRLVVYGAFLSSTGWAAFVLVCRGLREVQASARWLAALSVTLLLQHALLGVVDAMAGVGLHLFQPWFALPVSLVLVVLLHRWLGGGDAVAALREDTHAAVAALREVSGSWLHRLLIAWGAIAATARALAGLVSPPLTWDTLTYHALKSAEWVQAGFRIRTLAPDQFGYLTYYPMGAEEPAAWAMLFLEGDLGLPFVGIAHWSACGFAVYALARALHASRPQAFRAAALVAFLPALLSEMVSGYADMFVLFAFLGLGFALVLLSRRYGRAEAMLLGASAGLLACAKPSGLPVACVAIGGLLLIPVSGPGQVSRPRALTWAAVMALVMAAPHYLPVWIERGSPFYPFGVSIGGWSLGDWNPQLRALFAGELVAGDPNATSGMALLRALVVPFSSPRSDFMGFGPALVLLIPLAAMGLFARFLRDRDAGPQAPLTLLLVLATMAVLPATGIMSKAFAGQRALWLEYVGRLLLPLPAMLAVLGATVRSRVASPYLVAGVVMTMLMAWPAGIGPSMRAAMRAVAPWLALAIVVSVLALAAFARLPVFAARRKWGLPLSLVIAGLTFVVPLAKLRREVRYAIYEAAASPASPAPTFIMHPTAARYGAAWELWRAVDDGVPHRIAAAYGWAGVGDNWFRYPLLGSQLQNRVLYVPITRGGDVIDYQDAGRVRGEADESAWLARLRDARIDLVFLGEPAPPERAFVLRHPESFELVARARAGASELYRFRP